MSKNITISIDNIQYNIDKDELDTLLHKDYDSIKDKKEAILSAKSLKPFEDDNKKK